MIRRLIPGLFAVLLCIPASAENLLELFQKAKAQIKSSSWKDALTTLDQLDTESQKPGLENQRKQLEPALALYRGVAFSSLGRTKEGAEQFEEYLATNPNAALDPAIYPRKAVSAMEQARSNIAARDSSGMPSLAVSYRSFHPDPSTFREPPSPEWADGPVRFLLTAEEKKEWSSLKDSVARSEFVDKFWKTHDPTPETPDNEMRKEFERRVAFADERFGQGEIPGSATDRGMVFVLLGPPTYAGRKPMRTGDDSMEDRGLSTVRPHDSETEVRVATEQGRQTGRKISNAQTRAIEEKFNMPSQTMSVSATNDNREIWHYRHELLPPGIPYQQVDFDFITRAGYGEKILQRDAPALATLDGARKPAAWTPAVLEKKAKP